MTRTAKSKVYFASAKEVVTTSLPIVGMMTSGLLMMLIDRICLAQYSEKTLIASGPAIYTAMGILSFFTSTIILTRTFVGQANGAGVKNDIAKAAGIGLVTALLLGLILLSAHPLISMIPSLSSRPQNIQHLEVEFLYYVPFFGFFSIFNTCFSSIFIGILRTRVAMVVGIICNVLDSFFSVGLVFGYFGLPEMGMAGSSAGTLVSAATCFLIYLILLLRSGILPGFEMHLWLKDIGSEILAFLKVGLPAGLSNALEIFSNTAFVWIVGGISAQAMLANNIALAVNYVAIIPIIGFGIGSSTLAANKIGKRDESGIGILLICTFALSGLYVLIIGSCEVMFPQVFAYPFISKKLSEEALLGTYSTIGALWSYAGAFMVSMIMSGILEAYKRTKTVFFIRLLITWGVTIPVIAYVANANSGKSEMVAFCWHLGAVLELMIGLVYLLFFLIRYDKQLGNFSD